MTKKKQETKFCGIVMPISDCDGMPESHWSDVLKIVKTTATEAEFETRLVSDTYESNLIHKEILQNIYNDDLIICDVSGRNPNVFFELGIRMATQQPTVIIKDDVTSYPFDTGPNRYIEYPRDLRHPQMEKFKIELKNAIETTIEQDKSKSFIGVLGTFTVPEVETTSVPMDKHVLEELRQIKDTIKRFNQPKKPTIPPHIPTNKNMLLDLYQKPNLNGSSISKDKLMIQLTGYSEDEIESALIYLRKIGGTNADLEYTKNETGHLVKLKNGDEISDFTYSRLISELKTSQLLSG